MKQEHCSTSLAAAWAINSLAYSIVYPFIPIYLHEERNIPMDVVGTIFPLMGLAVILAPPLSGWLTDRIGRNFMMQSGQGLRGAVFLVLALFALRHAPFWAFALLLMVNSAVGTFFQVAADSYLADFTTQEERPRVYSKIRIGTNIGWAVGPMLGAFLARTPFSLMFAMTALLCIAGMCYTARCCPEIRPAGAPLPAASESELPAVLAAPRRLEDSERLAGMLPEVIERAGSSFDVVVVNTGSLWGEQHAVLAERASRVLFLVDQRASSLQACKRALALCGRCGIPTGQFLFAVNRCKRGAPLSSIDAACLLQGASVVELRDGGRAVDELMAAGQPLGLIQDENPLCVSLENVLADILPASASPARPAPAFERAGDDCPKAGGALSRLRRRVACLC